MEYHKNNNNNNKKKKKKKKKKITHDWTTIVDLFYICLEYQQSWIYCSSVRVMGDKEYTQSLFLSQNKKNNVYSLMYTP